MYGGPAKRIPSSVLIELSASSLHSCVVSHSWWYLSWYQFQRLRRKFWEKLVIRDTLDIESCLPTMKVFRFVEGKGAIACGASEVCHGFCEDTNVKNPHARWYRTLCGGSSSPFECCILLPKRSYSCSSDCLVLTLPAAEQYLRLVSFCSLQQAGMPVCLAFAVQNYLM